MVHYFVRDSHKVVAGVCPMSLVNRFSADENVYGLCLWKYSGIKESGCDITHLPTTGMYQRSPRSWGRSLSQMLQNVEWLEMYSNPSRFPQLS